MISLSPLPSAHRSFFQQTAVRPSIRFYPNFSLAKGRSSRFASIPANYIALLGLAFATARLRLTLLMKITSRLIMQKARGQTGLRHSPPTVCRHTVSGSISLPSPGFFSPFPHGTGSLSVRRTYLALRDGPRSFSQGFSCPAILRCLLRVCWLRLSGFHALWPPFPEEFGSPADW